MDERTEYWKIATDRLLDDKEGDKDKKEKAANKQPKFLSLYAEERYADPTFRLDLQRRKVVQWRLRERVRHPFAVFCFCCILASQSIHKIYQLRMHVQYINKLA